MRVPVESDPPFDCITPLVDYDVLTILVGRVTSLLICWFRYTTTAAIAERIITGQMTSR